MPAWLRILLRVAFLTGYRLAITAEILPDAVSARWLTRTWQTEEGLPDNNVTGVEQTTDGFLWVSTLGGLVRFDGASFEEFSTTHLPKVPSLNVRKMYLDRRGQLWLAMDRGALIRVGTTAARVFNADDGFPRSRVAAITEDREGRVCLVAGSEICQIEGEKVHGFDEVGAEGGFAVAPERHLAQAEQLRREGGVVMAFPHPALFDERQHALEFERHGIKVEGGVAHGDLAVDLAINAVEVALAVGVHVDPDREAPGTGGEDEVNEPVVEELPGATEFTTPRRTGPGRCPPTGLLHHFHGGRTEGFRC